MPNHTELDALAQCLGLPADSLPSLARLSPAQLGELLSAVEAAVRTRSEQLDHALGRVLFWPLKRPLLAMLRRA